MQTNAVQTEIPRIRLPMPHPGQIKVRLEAKRFNALCAGRRWRKTTHCMALAVESAVEGGVVIWGAPTYDQSRIAFQEAVKAVRGLAKPNITFMEIHIPGAGKILFRSLDDPANIKGHTADGVIIDEAASVHPDAWYESLRYMLLDTNGWAWLIGTPKGSNNWFKTEWDRFKASPQDSMAWQAPTVGCEVLNGKLYRKPHPLENPFIPFNEIRRAYETTTYNNFREDILAEFLQNEGVVFRNVQACLINEEMGNPAFHIGHTMVAGVDWGQTYDFTAISVCCVNCRTEVDIQRFNQSDWAFLLSRVRNIITKWHCGDVLVEYNSIGGPNYEALQTAGFPVRPFITTNKTKAIIIQQLALCFDKQDFLWLDVPWATSELIAYESKINMHKNVIYGAPPGQHDDTVIARALSCYASVSPREIEFT